jgi:hypothetical protein
MGATGRRVVEEMFDASVVERRIRGFIRERLLSIRSPVAARIPPPAEVVAMEADGPWADEFHRRERVSFPDGSGVLRRLFDRGRLASLGWVDTLEYAARIGWVEVLEVLRERLQRGSVGRG